MATRLELVNQLHKESGRSGTIATTIGATGQAADAVRRLDYAYNSIQRAPGYNWRFLWVRWEFTTQDGVDEYSAANADPPVLNDWIPLDSRRLPSIFWYPSTGTVDDSELLPFMPFDDWERCYKLQPPDPGEPEFCSINPLGRICIGPVPDSTGYEIRGRAYRRPHKLTADDSTPIIPEEFQDLIVWRGMMRQAATEEDSSNYSDGMSQYNEGFVAMVDDQHIDDVVTIEVP